MSSTHRLLLFLEREQLCCSASCCSSSYTIESVNNQTVGVCFAFIYRCPIPRGEISGAHSLQLQRFLIQVYYYYIITFFLLRSIFSSFTLLCTLVLSLDILLQYSIELHAGTGAFPLCEACQRRTCVRWYWEVRSILWRKTWAFHNFWLYCSALRKH